MDKPFPAPRCYLRSISSLLIISILSGCTSLGVRPNRGDYLLEASQQCTPRHNSTDEKSTFRTCMDYEQGIAEAYGLIDAYEARAKMNRWAIYAGAVIGLASVGALAGLGAFGQAGSDAAKIIPLAGSFAGGVVAFLHSDEKSKAYDEAARTVREGLKNAGREQNGASIKRDVTFPQFHGHLVKPLPPSLHTRLGSDSQGLSGSAADYRTPQCIQRYPASPLHGSHTADGTPARA